MLTKKIGEKVSFIHQDLANGRWRTFSLLEQLGNVGSEIDRTINYKKRNLDQMSQEAFERGLELLDLTIQDPKNITRLRELSRVREVLVDYFMYDNIYGSTDELMHNYFFAFAYAARNVQHQKEIINKSKMVY
jgi:hypothetical protein